MSPDTAVYFLPAVYLLLQVVALFAMSGRWLGAAMLPALVMAGALLVFILGMIVQASEAALPLIVGLPLATLYLGVLWLAFLVLGRRRTVRKQLF